MYEMTECPYCSSKETPYQVSDLPSGLKRWQCRECGSSFSPFSRTPLAGSKISLETWTKASEIFLENPEITSVRLGELLGVTQKTAWGMRKKLKIFGVPGIFMKGVTIINDEIHYYGSPKKIIYNGNNKKSL